MAAQTLHHSPVRTAVSKAASLLTTPLLPEDYLDAVLPLRAGAQLRAKVLAITAETADAVSIRLLAGRDWQGHKPGQYVRIGVDVDGVRQWRSYSVTSAPQSGQRVFTITVKAQPGGIVSQFLHQHLHVGQLIFCEPAAGAFTWPCSPPAKALFITAGSGITPIMSMLRAGAADSSDITMIHSDRTASATIFAAELRNLSAHNSIELIEWASADRGHLTPADIVAAVPDWQERYTWACGPTGLLDSCEQHWAEAGLRDRLATERFVIPVVADSPGGQVTFSESSKAAYAAPGVPLLTVGEEAGVLMPSGCRMGICFACVATLTTGAVRDVRNGDVTLAPEGSPVPIQTCVSAAAGPCTIKL